MAGDKVRLDLSRAIKELKPSDSSKAIIVGHRVRQIEVVKFGERVHVNLDNDSRTVYCTVVSTSAPR